MSSASSSSAVGFVRSIPTSSIVLASWALQCYEACFTCCFIIGCSVWVAFIFRLPGMWSRISSAFLLIMTHFQSLTCRRIACCQLCSRKSRGSLTTEVLLSLWTRTACPCCWSKRLLSWSWLSTWWRRLATWYPNFTWIAAFTSGWFVSCTSCLNLLTF